MKYTEHQLTGKYPVAQLYSATVVNKDIVTFGGWDGKEQHFDVHILDTGILFDSFDLYSFYSLSIFCFFLLSIDSLSFSKIIRYGTNHMLMDQYLDLEIIILLHLLKVNN
jgi:hypothetical protein